MLTTICTDRLVLRRWRAQDRAVFALLNADSEVMRCMPRRLTSAESNAWIDSIEGEFERDGFGLWAVEARESRRLIGTTGLNRVPFEASFTPAVEIGWRFERRCCGRGFATEAAQAALRSGFADHGLGEIVAETANLNGPSRRVMERLGMRHDPIHDFDHAAYPVNHPARPHVLYRVSSPRLGEGETL